MSEGESESDGKIKKAPTPMPLQGGELKKVRVRVKVMEKLKIHPPRHCLVTYFLFPVMLYQLIRQIPYILGQQLLG